jgi:uncharacterized protein (DUF58 family)
MSGFKLFGLALMVGALAVISGQPALFRLVDVLGAALLVCGVWSVLSIRGLAFERILDDDRAQVGGRIEQHLHVQGVLPFPRIWAELSDGGTLPGYQVGHVLDLGMGGRRSVRLTAPCLRRGRYQVGPARVVGGDPLGLFRPSRRLGEPRSVLVYPATVDLAGATLPGTKASGGDWRRKSWNQTSLHVSGTREYRPGDPLRHVHWRSTAHTGQLMVKEFDAEPVGDVWICLDLEAAVQRGEGDDSTEEYAVTIAASFAKHLLAHGRSIGLVARGAEHHLIPMGHGERQLTRALEELAVARAKGEIPVADLLIDQLPHFSRSHSVLVVTPSPDERWSAALAGLRDRGMPARAILVDASTFGNAPSPRVSFEWLDRRGIPSLLVKRGDPLSEVLVSSARSMRRA